MWISDPARCAAAGIPAGTAFATKPALALRMILRALDAGTPADWVTADEVYGADPGLRDALQERQVSYVLAVAKSHPATTAAGVMRADAVARKLPPQAWQRLSAGAGSKGHRSYDWASSSPPVMPATCWPGSPGGAATSTPPAPATTSGKQLTIRDLRRRPQPGARRRNPPLT